MGSSVLMAAIVRGVPRILLVVPSATYRAPDFVEAAGRLGVGVVLASDARQALASTMVNPPLEVDLDDIEKAAVAIVEHGGVTGFDAVVGVDDQSVAVANEVARAVGFAHNPREALRATRDKLALRAALTGAGVAQPGFAPLWPGDEPGAVAARIGFPCVLKPTGLSASRGVIRVDDGDGARAADARIRSILVCAGLDPAAPLVVEAFIPGPEVAIEAMVSAGEMEVLAVFDKPDPLDGPFFEETIYTTPSRHPRPTVRAAVEEVARAVAALGLREGPVHAEVRLAAAGPVVLEVAARTIGGLCGRVLRFGAGVSLEELVIRHALGRRAGFRREARAAGVMMLPIPGRGRLTRVDGVDAATAVPGVRGIEITVAPGREIEPLPEGDRYLGFAFAAAATPDEVEHALRSAHARLGIVVEPSL